MSGTASERVRLKVDVEDAHLAPESLWFATLTGVDKAAYERLTHKGWAPEVADLAIRELRQKHADLKARRPPLKAGEVVEVVLVYPHYENEPEAENGLLVENDRGARGLVLRGETEPAPPAEGPKEHNWGGHYA
jgi:hypothetical protein